MIQQDCKHSLTTSEYCESHESYYHPFAGLEGKCPWCERDKFREELGLIKEVFQAAVANRRGKGGQQVPYHGDFCSIPPSTIRDLENWVKIFKAALDSPKCQCQWEAGDSPCRVHGEESL